jgi:hypothetical protein
MTNAASSEAASDSVNDVQKHGFNTLRGAPDRPPLNDIPGRSINRSATHHRTGETHLHDHHHGRR